MLGDVVENGFSFCGEGDGCGELGAEIARPDDFLPRAAAEKHGEGERGGEVAHDGGESLARNECGWQMGGKNNPPRGHGGKPRFSHRLTQIHGRAPRLRRGRRDR